MFIEFLRQRQLHPEPGAGGAAAPEFIPLGDIDAEEEVVTDETKKADLEKAAAQKLIDDKKVEDDAATLLEEEAKKKKPEANAPPTDEPEEGSDEGDEGTFWDDVDKLRGEAIEVDFGDVEPDSPEGALIYERAVRMDELNKFEDHLKTNHPRAYAYMSHILDGGKEEDFFKIAGEPGTLPTEEELEADIEKQKEIVTRNQKAKGNNDKAIERIIKGAIADDDLEELSKEALKEEAKRQSDALKEVEAQADRDTKERAEQIQVLAKFVNGVAAGGKLDNIIIPEKDRKPFAKALTDNIRYENGKFLLVTEVNNENAIKVFKEKFFSYKNGDLTDLIEKAARTENTKRLQRSIPQNKKPLANNGQRNDVAFTPLSEMED